MKKLICVILCMLMSCLLVLPVMASPAAPEIISIPESLTVEQGEEAEIRCVAKSPDDSQLSYIWYESHTGEMNDLRAINREAEFTDCLICDTSTLGTRYYACMVQTSEGGMVYSNIIPVTVIEKQAEPDPTEPLPPQETQPTEPQPTTAPTEPETPPIQAPTEAPGDTDKEDVKTDNAEKDNVKTDGEKNATPWWVIAIIAVAAAGIGFGIAAVVFKKKA